MSIVHFQVDGEWYTDFVRNLVLEQDWTRAIRNLETGLDGIDIDSIYQILSGKAKLVGTNELDLVEEEEPPAEYLRALVETYGATFVESNRHWKPYAKVCGWGPDDAKYACQFFDGAVPVGRERQRKWSLHRCEYYADDPKHDEVHMMGESEWETGGEAILWKRVNAPPTWMPVFYDREAALAAARKIRPLPVRGYEYGGEDCPVRAGALAEATGKFESQRGVNERSTRRANSLTEVAEKVRKAAEENPSGMQADLFHATLAANPMIKPEAVKGTLDAIFNSDRTDTKGSPLEPADVEKDHGWILRDGTFYACGYHGHFDLAHRLLTELMGVEDDDCANAERVAEEKGWLCVRSGAFRDQEVRIYSYGPEATKEQKATAHKWCKHRDLNVRDILTNDLMK